jgi:predicted anti-sigma-YlaC factor YlaD
MRNLQLPTRLRHLRRQASSLTPELARLSDAVGDTLSAAASAATSTANDTARGIGRKVRRQRTHSRKRGWALLALAGTGIVLALLARRPATEQPAALGSEADAAGRPAPWSTASPAIDDDAQAQVATPNDAALADLAATVRAPSRT